MLQDEIILDLDKEITVKINELSNIDPDVDVDLDLWPETEILITTYSDAVISVDLESMGSEIGNSIIRLFGKIARPFLFTKSVIAKKETFGKTDFILTNNRQTSGIAEIDPANHNIVARPITFVKTVSGYKTTFGRSSLILTNNIYTDGFNTLGHIDFYGEGDYGDGVYGGGLDHGASVSRLIAFGSTISGKATVKSAVSTPIVLGITTSGFKSTPAKQTSVAEISLASHSVPNTRTNHSIKVRARTTSGSTGVLKAALYEGGVNRSGDLTTSILSNTLTDYTLSISDVAAASITDYSNLSIKVWGYDSTGAALVFEISKLYLEVPIGPTTHYGAVSRPFTFTKAVSGVINSKRTSTAEISLASHGTPSVRTNHSIKVRARTTSGSTGVLKAELYEGSTVRSGATPLATSALTNSLADYSLAIPDAAAASITSYSNLSIKFWGFDSAGNALVFEVSKIYLELPTT